MATKKKSLGRGMEAMFPEQAERPKPEETPNEEWIAGDAVGKVAMILNESLAAVDDVIAERMLRMIIALCQSEMKGVYNG